MSKTLTNTRKIDVIHKTVFSLLIVFTLSACATTNQQKRLLMTSIGIASGAAIGFSRPEEPSKNAVLYGSLVGVAAAVASEFIFDDEKEKEKLEKETISLRAENGILIEKQRPKMEKEGSTLLEAELPKDMRPYIQPGSWKRFKLDRWVQDQDNDNVWFRQTEMFEVTPPSTGN